ncbi:MAG: SEC-C metal-binding domain-containing protein [Terriglobales bacterium]
MNTTAYRHFREHRQVIPGAHRSEPRRSAPKVGRNDPCPCGSGKIPNELTRRNLSLMVCFG